MQKLLTPKEIEDRLQKLPVEWSAVSGAQLERDSKFDDFKSALSYVNRVGAIAEKLNHHPDISFGWGRVAIVVTTHSLGGLTEKDFDFAKALDEIIS